MSRRSLARGNGTLVVVGPAGPVDGPCLGTSAVQRTPRLATAADDEQERTATALLFDGYGGRRAR
jgi:hypothetical protein